MTEVVIHWRDCDSSNVRKIGWPATGEPVMFVEFKNGHVYGYQGVSRQRAVAAWISRSTGRYMNNVIKPRFPGILVTM